MNGEIWARTRFIKIYKNFRDVMKNISPGQNVFRPFKRRTNCRKHAVYQWLHFNSIAFILLWSLNHRGQQLTYIEQCIDGRAQRLNVINADEQSFPYEQPYPANVHWLDILIPGCQVHFPSSARCWIRWFVRDFLSEHLVLTALKICYFPFLLNVIARKCESTLFSKHQKKLNF